MTQKQLFEETVNKLQSTAPASTANETIEQQLKKLPEPHRSQALKNMWWEYRNDISPDQLHALRTGFNWLHSPEKFDYWNDFYKSLEIIVRT